MYIYTLKKKNKTPQLEITSNRKFWTKENRQESRGPPSSDSCSKRIQTCYAKKPKQPTCIFFSVREKKAFLQIRRPLVTKMNVKRQL